MITEPFWKISKKLLKRKEHWDSKINPRSAIFFLNDITEKRPSTILASFQKICPSVKPPKKDEIIILGSSLGPKSQADLLGKINELENVIGIDEILNAHYGCFMLENCFSLSKLLYFLRTSICFNHPALLEKYDKTVRDGLSKVCNVNFDNIWSTQLPAEMGGSGGFIRIIISTSRLFGISCWCE